MANKKLEIFELEDGNAEEEMAAVKARITLKDVKDARIVSGGPWDIMSRHFVEHKDPPPGISSFTKIRLGRITAEQLVSVKPGESVIAIVSPLSRKGKTPAVKIPLPGGS